MKIKWGLLGMLVSGIGLLCDYMSNKEEEEERNNEIESLKKRAKELESKVYCLELKNYNETKEKNNE